MTKHSKKNGKRGRRLKIKYERDGDNLIIRYATRKLIFDREAVRDLFEELPERANALEIMRTAHKIGLDVDYFKALALIEFFDRDVNYNAHAILHKCSKILIKQDFPLREETRKLFTIERSVIGTPWET